jgi:hypothetical protein
MCSRLTNAAARLVRGQVAHLDDALARHGMAGHPAHGLLDGRVEIALEEQPVVPGAAPACRREDAIAALQQHQVGREARQLGRVVPAEDVRDESLGVGAPGRTRDRMPGVDPVPACAEHALDGAQELHLGSRIAAKASGE